MQEGEDSYGKKTQNWRVDFGPERFLGPEIFFSPQTYAKKSLGMEDSVQQL